MLAGAGGIDLVVLVVAADESVMPQTREHFDICRLLRVRSGLVALTKSDLADAETLELARLEVRELVAGSFLDGAPIVPVSAKTGNGLDAFRRATDKHVGEHLFVPAPANLRPAFAVYLRAPGERRYRPLALAVLRVEEGRVVEVVHWDRPELFDAFGLPMSFSPSGRSNQDEVNAKEVR